MDAPSQVRTLSLFHDDQPEKQNRLLAVRCQQAKITSHTKVVAMYSPENGEPVQREFVYITLVIVNSPLKRIVLTHENVKGMEEFDNAMHAYLSDGYLVEDVIDEFSLDPFGCTHYILVHNPNLTLPDHFGQT